MNDLLSGAPYIYGREASSNEKVFTLATVEMLCNEIKNLQNQLVTRDKRVFEIIASREQLVNKVFELSNELIKCFDIAQYLDSKNPTLKGAFTGTVSERISRHVKKETTYD